MNSYWIFFCVFLCLVHGKKRDQVRHEVTWDPAEDVLAYGQVETIDVRMGDYMDIFCPQYDADESKVNTFVIYNVSKQSFSECKFGKDTKKIFACDTPNQSKVLTTKFQKYSPNPLGFIFHPTHSYYYMAAESLKSDSCENVMRLKINVHPRLRHDHLTSTTGKTTTLIKTTTTTTTTKPTKRSTILIPNIVSTPRARPDIVASSPKVGQKGAYGGGAASTIVSLSIFWTIFIALATTLYLER